MRNRGLLVRSWRDVEQSDSQSPGKTPLENSKRRRKKSRRTCQLSQRGETSETMSEGRFLASWYPEQQTF